MLQGKNAANKTTDTRTGVCEPLMPDVVASKAQLQLCELGKSTYGFNTQESGMGACLGQYGILNRSHMYVAAKLFAMSVMT